MLTPLRAVEFFSGIGAFAEAVRQSHAPVDIVAAYDQDRDAGRVYFNNFGLNPSTRTLDSIPAGAIPEADLWWLSPPCQPYTRRGRQRDIEDPRAASLLHLASFIPIHQPRWILLENVLGFAQSRAREILLTRLRESSYHVCETALCPTQFGIPMRRPRCFLVACLDGMPVIPPPPPPRERQRLTDFLDASPQLKLMLPAALVERYKPVFNIVDPADPHAVTICFTAQYGKCLKSGGSLLPAPCGGLRRFSAREILNLLGFSPTFELPSDLSLRRAWNLTGNSADMRCLRHIAQAIFQLDIVTASRSLRPASLPCPLVS